MRTEMRRAVPAPAPCGAPQVPEISLTFAATPLAVRQTLSRTLHGLAGLRLDPEERGAVELVLAEALNNVVEHAYAGASGWVQLDCCHDDLGLHVTIRDRGRPMPRDGLPLGEAANDGRAPVDMPEGGFGWFIIRDLARDIRYRREGGMNVLSLRIAVGPVAGQG